MTEKKFSLYNAFTYALKALLDDASFFVRFVVTQYAVFAGVGLAVVLACIPVWGGLIPTLIEQGFNAVSGQAAVALFASNAVLVFAAVLLMISIFAFLSAGYIHVMLSYKDTGKGSLGLLFSASFAETAKLMVTLFLMMIFIMLGFLFFIVPGVILAIRWRYALYCIIDYDAGIVQSLRDSWAMTKGTEWSQFIFLILSVMPIAPYSLWSVFIVWPFINLSTVHAYRQLCPLDDIEPA